MTDQILIVVDDKDKFLKYAPRKDCHTDNGIHHRAFTILILNKDKRILLQKRKHEIWDGYWDLTNSHPLHLDDKDETYEEAAIKCLKREWGISVELSELKKIFVFNYFERYDGKCENEYCALIAVEYSGKLIPNKETCYEFEWVILKDLITNVKKNSKNYTPWLVKAVNKLTKHPFVKEMS